MLNSIKSTTHQNTLKTKHLLPVFLLIGTLLLSKQVIAQESSSFVNTLRMEARADFNYSCDSLIDGYNHDRNNTYGFNGMYFNLHMGGNLGDKVSYYFRQRIVANPGSVSFFDNTDFLYVNYAPNKNWSFRGGKDALIIGGFEYDHAPIDVLFNSYYWSVFYCFQMAVSASYHSDDGNHTLSAQITNSPYIHYNSPFGDNSLLAYNLCWSGKMGHFKTLYSASLFERARGYYMSYIALGNKLTFDRWDLYLDLIHHGVTTDQLTQNWAIISCANIYLSEGFNIFVKGGYEQNLDKNELTNYQATGKMWDCLTVPGQKYGFYGIGFELKPSFYRDLRIHGYVADFASRQHIINANDDLEASGEISHHLNVNFGLTWNMDIHGAFKKRATQH